MSDGDQYDDLNDSDDGSESLEPFRESPGRVTPQLATDRRRLEKALERRRLRKELEDLGVADDDFFDE